MDLGHWQGVDEHRSEGVEEDLEGRKEGLASDRIEEDCLKSSGQIRVETIDTQRLVMCQVVGPEGGAVWNANGQVRKHGKDPVCLRRSESQVVRYLVNGEEKVLVGRGTDYVCGKEECP